MTTEDQWRQARRDVAVIKWVMAATLVMQLAVLWKLW
jgi:hypothetical protein